MIVKGFTPHPDQRRVINTIENSEAKFITLVTGRQWGKTLLGINLILKWALTTNNSTLMWVAPVYSVSKKVLEEITNAVGGTPVVKSINKSDMEIRFINGSKILFRSGEREDNLRGNTLDYLVVDEAAFIKDTVWNQVLKQTVMVKGKRVFFISTPKGKNFLYSLHMKGLEGDEKTYLSLNGTSYDTPYISKDELEEAKQNLPEAVYRQEILAEFIDDGGEVFRNLEDYCVLNRWSEPEGGKKYYAGLDLGRTNDYTVLTIFDDTGKVVKIYRERQKSWDVLVREILNEVKRYKAELQVEVNNIGDVIYEQLKKQYNNTHPFLTTNSSKQNIVEDLIYGLNEGNILLPSKDLFSPLYNEMSAFTFNYSPKTRQIKYEAPQGLHDDCVLSLAIGYNCLKQKKTSGTYYVY